LVLADARRRFGGRTLRVTLYVASLLVIALAVVDRRRRDIAPEIVRRRKTLRKLRAQIDRARQRPHTEAARSIADALRAMGAEVPNAPREALQSVLAQYETMIYAPGGTGTDPIDPALVQRAASLADQILKEAE
jgi:hypothetical protein